MKNQRTFGIEIEFLNAYFSDVANELDELNLKNSFIYTKHNVQPKSRGIQWHLKPDMSVCKLKNGRKTGGEISSPAYLFSENSVFIFLRV